MTPGRRHARPAARAAAALAVLLSAAAHAAPAPPADEDLDIFTHALNTATFEAGGLIFGNRLGAGYEHAVSDAVSLAATLSVALGWSHGAFVAATDSLWGLELGVGPRFFLGGSAPSGVYLGPWGTAFYGLSRQRGAMAHGYGFAGGALVGYNFVPFDILDLSVAAGALYRWDRRESAAGVVESAGVAPAVRLALGYAF